MKTPGCHVLPSSILGTDRVFGGFTDRTFGDTRNPKILKLFRSVIGGSVSFVRQVHGVNVIRMGNNTNTMNIDADGLVAYPSRENVAIGVRTADCVPILAVDPKTSIIGVAHAGWKGTLGNILSSLVATMEDSGARRDRLRLIFGPHIRMCCYTVSVDRITMFRSVSIPDSIRWTGQSGGKTTLSLSAILHWQALNAGVGGNNITDTGECTSCSFPRYFSFRRDTRNSFGEMTGFLCIRKIHI